MAARRTLDFLPSIFQTDTNKKFLSATLDQLVSEPNYQRLNGYIGRKFAPTYKTTDSYINEVDTDRQNYQLEPSVVIKNSSNQVDFYSSYTDLVNKLAYYGGQTTNHDRLFSGEYYSYDGLFDYDKFVNFSQYYWLPNGPAPISISAEVVPSQQTYTITRDSIDNVIKFAGKSSNNPEIVLARGGLYKFNVDQPGNKFWIQTEPGISGKKHVAPNISTRTIYGVTNNGTDSGTVEFSVPLNSAQDLYLNMPMLPSVDFAVDIPFSDLDGARWVDIVNNYNGLDGITINPDSKLVVFLNLDDSDSAWTRSNAEVIAAEHRRGVWRIRLTQDGNGDSIINLDYIRDIPVNNKIYSRLGLDNSNVDFYRTDSNYLIPVPVLTAQLNTLYYQDANDPAMYGKIRLVDRVVDPINVDSAIIGFKNYTSPSGVEFTNGLVVAFDGTVEPAFYANKTFIVEGVGSGIRLVDFDNLACPEPFVKINSVPIDSVNFSTDNYDEPYRGPAIPDYVTVNRSSKDLNAWARHNRWFHTDVILKSAEYNNVTPLFDQGTRGQRPIIEFNPDIQLTNFGRIGKKPVEHVETGLDDAFNQVQHSETMTVGGTTYKIGDRVLFANDKDPLVRSQIYRVEYKVQDDSSYASYYDGVGTGTITVTRPVLSYYSVSNPVEIDYATYTWDVNSNETLFTAKEVHGLEWPEGYMVGTVTNVEFVGGLLYRITFTTPYSLVDFVPYDITILGTGGIATVDGTGTSFLSEVEPGSLLFADEVYFGTVESVMTDTKLQLTAPAELSVTNSVFQYKNPRIQLIISEDPNDAIDAYDTVVARGGNNKGNSYWYDGTNWNLAQLKMATNQEPLFDVFDFSDTSYSDYNGTKFVGSKIFAYKKGTGANDSVLGFPLSYSSVNNTVADIQFENSFDNETFIYVSDTGIVTKKVNTGYLRENLTRTDFTRRNVWTTVVEPSKQYQVISKEYTGRTNYFEIDILPAVEKEIPNIKVFLNNTLLTSDQYGIVKVGKRNTVKVGAQYLTVGDKVDILIYSNSTSKIGYYQIPANLDFNSKNIELSTISAGQIRNHLVALNQNSHGIQGSVPGYSNLRDFSIKSQGGNILQHSAPIIYPSLFLIHNQANFMNSLDYARREYTKFKNKFLETAMTLKGLNPNDVVAAVDKILLSINAVKNSTFAWYYSDMVPYGEADVISYTVLNTLQRQYKINSIFNDTVLQSRAVLVYHNGTQLIKGIDYTFPQDRMAVVLADHIVTTINDTIEIRDYKTTDGNYIPETPTKLGLYPKFKPGIYLDQTYREPVDVIQGHDGSLTPVFGDFRDQLLVELELRIYNNIKLDPAIKPVDLRSYIPGRFRTTDYSTTEFTKIVSQNFLKWIGANKVDYISHDYFVNGDPFTYNYRSSKDAIDGSNLPGWWRGIYKYFYDTDRPHTHPWEMLGFTERPDWWIDTYGPAPYTSSNDLLWEDLEEGIVRAPTIEILPQYARPGLSKVIPVDEHGTLLPPMGRVAAGFDATSVSESFQIGDGSPVESAWQRTSEYPFALQAAFALMKPALYFGTMYDVSDYYKDSGLAQYKTVSTNRRINLTDINLNGVTERSAGYVNWIVDYMTNLGLDSRVKLQSLLDNLEVQLTYKVGGYTDQNYLTVLAEQYSPTSTNESVIIPNESYTIHLNKSVPVERIAYSAVIVEKTPTGFTVSGYNTANPYFIIVPSETAGSNYTVRVENLTGIIYKDYRKQKIAIPYGHEFATRQQVVDFLVSYQRYLFAQGFVFDEFDEELAISKDWVLSVKEFLTWSLQGWKPGNILVLSPVSDTLKMYSVNSVVDEITNEPNGSKILDPNFNVIRTTDITVMRDNDLFKVRSINGSSIAFAELNLTQFEHVLVFDNSTVFNDIIYKPESGSRQYRLKLVGSKTGDWDGSLNAGGFIYNKPTVDEWRSGRDYLKGDIISYKSQYYVAADKIAAQTSFSVNSWKLIDKASVKTGLLPNFANHAGRFINVYDADSSLLDVQMARMSSGLIGFRSRNYLTDLNVDNTSQTKFYQGYIKKKGTAEAVNSLLGAKFNNLNNTVKFYEEWAVRVGEYGAIDSNQSVEIVLDEFVNKNNPTGISIIDDGATAQEGMVGVEDKELWSRPDTIGPVRFLNRDANTVKENDIETAGYVNVNDIDATLFDSTGYQTLSKNINDISSGYIIWVAKDHNTDWNIYRATETDSVVTQIEYGLDAVGTITTRNAHNLSAKDVIVIKNLTTDFDGFYTVETVVDRETITVSLTKEQGNILKKGPVTGSGLLFVLDSVRFNTPSDVANYSPPHGWKDADRVWIDRTENDNWAVYEKSSPWDYNSILSINPLSPRPTDHEFGTSIRIDKNNRLVLVGAPGSRTEGEIHVFDRNNSNNDVAILNPQIPNLVGLGHCVDIANNIAVSGTPDSRSGQGMVLVFQLFTYVNGIYFTPSQAIKCPSGATGAQFGYSVSQSQDGKWMYVGAPGEATVYSYQYIDYEFRTDYFDLSLAYAGFTLPYTVTDDKSLAVYIQDRLLILGEDYNLINNRVILTVPGAWPLNGFITINQRGYYDLVTTLQVGVSSTGFGFSVKSSADGEQVVIGAPNASTNSLIKAGRAYVYFNDGASLKLSKILYPPIPTYRAQFGYSVDICANSCSVYIGAPGYSYQDYSGGAVYRYVNVGKSLGRVVGTVSNPTVAAGNAIRINGQVVTFTGGGLQSIINDINAAEIVGVRASSLNNKIVITSTVQVNENKLNLASASGTVMGNLGLVVYDLAQTILKPLKTATENFGSLVRVSPETRMLAVSSTYGSIKDYAQVDAGETTLDGQATRVMDNIPGSGAVYILDFMPSAGNSTNEFGNFIFSQELSAPTLAAGDRFGISIDFNETNLVVGAAFNDAEGQNFGRVFEFNNPLSAPGWAKVREQMSSVDVTSVNGISLYRKDTEAKLTTLDYIDPAKGKILGIAEQDLTYKSSRDPAVYNAGSSIDSGAVDYHWGSRQVGQTWWNLDSVRYIDYEQGELYYRLNNWGRVFPGSEIHVYEWIESYVLPSQYVDSGFVGTPLHADDSSYVESTYVDSDTGLIKTRYYYWVRGITEVPVNSNRKLSTKSLELAIEDPKAQGIPYAAILADNSLGIYNVTEYLSGANTIVKVDYDTVINDNLVHSEFELVKEGDPASTMPDRITDKIIDSISTIDASGRPVPDPRLKSSQKIGLGLRPRQTLVEDRYAALKNIAQFVNTVFAATTAAYKLQNSQRFDAAHFFAMDPEPSDYDRRVANLEERSYVLPVPGETILVAKDSSHFDLWAVYEVQPDLSFKLIKNQSYDTKLMWDYTDWYASGYSKDTKADHIINEYKDIETITIVDGDIVRVNNSATGGFELYYHPTSDAPELVAVENGTLTLNDNFWNQEVTDAGFDNHTFAGRPFDLDYATETRNVLLGLKDDIFVDDLLENNNKLFFTIVQYILSEQKNVDWIFKTSFISVVHKLRELGQYSNYIKDNHEYYNDYINEVKPYRSKVRDYSISYTGNDQADVGITDFDLPAYYDKDLKRFRSPSGEYPDKDGALLLHPEYQAWSNNFTNSVDSILIATKGSGYSQAPAITIVANNDHGTGATAEAVINDADGSLLQIIVTNPGRGYRNVPHILINGDGAGAQAIAVLTNNKIRSVKTTIKFDRVTYGTSVTEWIAGKSYNTNDMVSYNGMGWIATAPSNGTIFNPGYFKQLADSAYTNANDRIAARYQPTQYQIPKEYDANGNIDLSRLVPGIVPDALQLDDMPEAYNDSAVQSYNASTYAETYTPQAINISGGGLVDVSHSYAPEELVPGTTFDNLNLIVITKINSGTHSIAYRMVKKADNSHEYRVIAGAHITELAQDLAVDDDIIYVTDSSKLTTPNPGALVPGIVYINGEKIVYYTKDDATNTLGQITRGVDTTSTPMIHEAGSTVTDASASRTVPSMTTVNTDAYKFKHAEPVFNPVFNVSSDIEVVANSLEVVIGNNPLTLYADYSITLYQVGSYNRVSIAFTTDAQERFAEGITIAARYTQEKIWLNQGVGTAANGAGLENSTTVAAQYLKLNPYN